jgi:hypothetical protein
MSSNSVVEVCVDSSVILRSFISIIPHLGYHQITHDDGGRVRACGTNERDEECIQNLCSLNPKRRYRLKD